MIYEASWKIAGLTTNWLRILYHVNKIVWFLVHLCTNFARANNMIDLPHVKIYRFAVAPTKWCHKWLLTSVIIFTGSALTKGRNSTKKRHNGHRQSAEGHSTETHLIRNWSTRQFVCFAAVQYALGLQPQIITKNLNHLLYITVPQSKRLHASL